MSRLERWWGLGVQPRCTPQAATTSLLPLSQLPCCLQLTVGVLAERHLRRLDAAQEACLATLEGLRRVGANRAARGQRARSKRAPFLPSTLVLLRR